MLILYIVSGAFILSSGLVIGANLFAQKSRR